MIEHSSRLTDDSEKVSIEMQKISDLLREADYCAGRYVPDMPFSLSASLVFEQNYGGVEGDSASSAELYALLSALAEVPIEQSMKGLTRTLKDVAEVGGIYCVTANTPSERRHDEHLSTIGTSACERSEPRKWQSS